MICNADELSITIEGKTIFNNTTATNLYRTADQKISALPRISSYTRVSKKRKIRNAFFMSHFNYFSLIWMFYSRSLECRINRLHESCLRIVYSDYTSTFEDLFDLDGSLTIHQRTIQTLAIEMFRV